MYNLCLLGWGNVNRTFVQLLKKKDAELRARDIGWRIAGVASRRLGWIANPEGLDPKALLAGQLPAGNAGNVRDWLRAAHADVLFEATSLHPQSGQPAIDHIRAALSTGAHAITANKGPIVHGYQKLRDLAASYGLRFLFESTVMDGVPIFSLFRETLPGLRLQGFHGVLNSTTNIILTGMEHGLSYESSLKQAQDAGIAETDPSHDIEGWDSAVKVAALATVLFEQPVPLADVERQGISELTGKAVREARAAGTPYKLVCRARRGKEGVTARVRPEKVSLSDPLAHVSGSSSIIYFETDIFPGLAITEVDPGVYATAYGMLADFVRAVS
ncbi:MAG: homoserine dehydrogenase [Acidobacteria bacterium]|nr:homoserine dehydrogenase [Acidobacteriota bacterium]